MCRSTLSPEQAARDDRPLRLRLSARARAPSGDAPRGARCGARSGVRTVFNLLGPLTNPAGARRQLIGVYALQWVEPMAHALAQLGCEHGMVVHGQPGIDELSPCGATTMATVRGRRGDAQRARRARARRRAVHARRPGAGATRSATPRSRSPCSAGEPGPAADATALNAAATLLVAGRAADLGEGLAAAREALRSGAAMATLSALRAAGKDTDMSYLEGIGAWTRERLEERRETRSLAAALLHRGAQGGDRRGQARLALAGRDRAGGGSCRSRTRSTSEDGAAAISVLTSGRDFGGSYADLAAVRAAVDAAGAVQGLLRRRVAGDRGARPRRRRDSRAARAGRGQPRRRPHPGGRGSRDGGARRGAQRPRAGAGARPRNADHRRQRARPGDPRDRPRAADRAAAPAAPRAPAHRGVGHRDARTTPARVREPAPTRCSSAPRSCATRAARRRSCGGGRDAGQDLRRPPPRGCGRRRRGRGRHDRRDLLGAEPALRERGAGAGACARPSRRACRSSACSSTRSRSAWTSWSRASGSTASSCTARSRARWSSATARARSAACATAISPTCRRACRSSTTGPGARRATIEALYAHWRAARAASSPTGSCCWRARLDAGNVAQAVREVRPYGVDCASGVESAAGIKDHERVRRFVAAAKEAG